MFLGAVLTVSAASCSATDATKASVPGVGDHFGSEAPSFQASDGGAADPTADAGNAGQASGPQTRFVHGIVNAGQLSLCHDPDRVLDDPATAEDEATPGPRAGELLGSAKGFGQISSFAALRPGAPGVLTLHGPRPPERDAGSSADAGSGPEAGMPPATDCSEDTLLGALPLPSVPGTDAGADDESALGSVYASGVILDQARVQARKEAVRQAYLAENAGDDVGAEAAARALEAQLLQSIGPQLTLGSGVPAVPAGNLRLSLAQLTPDVPGNDKTGGVRVCVTAGTLVTPVVPAPDTAPIGFRERRGLGASYAAGVDYHFRVFPASEWDGAAADCATTSLKPIAELTTSMDRKLSAAKAYSLLLLGAVNPVPICAPLDETSVISAGCELSTDQLGVRLKLLSD